MRASARTCLFTTPQRGVCNASVTHPCVVCVHDYARTVEREVSRRFPDLHQSNVLPASRRKELRSGAKRAQVLRLESDSKSNNYWNRTLLYTVAYVQRGSWLVVVQAARSRALELLRLRESVELRPVRVERALKNILGDADAMYGASRRRCRTYIGEKKDFVVEDEVAREACLRVCHV